MTSGGLAGAVSRTATSPLERLKVMQQVQSKAAQPYTGIVSGLKYMYQSEGWQGFFKGNGTNVARIAPYSALQFWFFDVYKAAIISAQESAGIRVSSSSSSSSSFSSSSSSSSSSATKPGLTPIWTLTAGALAGSTSTLFCYPLDIARSYLTVQTTEQQFKGIADVLQSIYRSEGIRGIFRGSVATLAGITPYIAINFATFDTLKRRYLPKPSDPTFTVINLGLGGISGGVAAALTYPTDVIRRRIQLQGLGKSLVKDMPQYSGTMDCIKGMYHAEGIKGFYKGLNACLFKVIPSMAIAFTIHESLRQTLKFDLK